MSTVMTFATLDERNRIRGRKKDVLGVALQITTRKRGNKICF